MKSMDMEEKKYVKVDEIRASENRIFQTGSVGDHSSCRNCIFNMKFIHSFFEREIRMTTGKRVEMSRRKITEVKEVFTKYLVLGGNHK